MMERACSVVGVRGVGEDVAGDTPEAVLARAEAAMDRGDLAEAAARVGELQGDAAAAFAEWLAAAKARISADAGLSRLEKPAVSAKGAGCCCAPSSFSSLRRSPSRWRSGSPTRPVRSRSRG